MPSEVARLVAASFVEVSFSFGKVIVAEGEEADALYVVMTGRARVVKTRGNGDEVTLRVLEPGDSFGEIGLLEGGNRTATVRTSSDVRALRLDAAVFRGLVASNPAIREHFELQMRQRVLVEFFRLHTGLGDLPPDVMIALLRALEPIEVPEREIIIFEGDGAGPLYVVQEGRLRARKEGRDVAYYSKGDYFGEVSLLTGRRRAATVEAISKCRLLRLSPTAFRALLDSYPIFRVRVEQEIERYDYQRVANIPLDFADELLPAELDALPTVSKEQVEATFESDEVHVSNGAEHGPFTTPDGRFNKRAERIRRFRHIWQVDEMDCGAACLAMVARHFGRDVSLSHVRQVVRTGIDGSSLKGITRGAEELGLASRSVKASKRNLDVMPLPSIVHWEGNHWIVVYDVDKKYVRVDDPAIGLRRLPRDEFENKWTGYAALFELTPAFENAPVGRARYEWLWELFARHKTRFVIAAVIALAVSALQLALPVFMQVVVDRVVPARDLGLLRLLLLSMAGVILAMLAGSIIHRYILSRIAVQLDGSAMDFLSQKMLALPMRYFYARRTGDIQRRLAGMQQARIFLVQNGVVALAAAAQLVTATVLMFIYSPLLAGVFVAAVPLYVAMMRFASTRLRPIFDSLEDSFGKYYSRQVDVIKGIEAVKAMGAEDVMRNHLLGEFNALTHRLFRADLTAMLYEGGVQLVAFTSLVVFVWIGSLQVLSGDLSIGEFVSFNALLVLANAPIILLLTLWDRLQLIQVLMTRLSDVFEEEPEQGADRSKLRPVPSLSGRVTFEGVGFQYSGPESPHILQGLSFDISAGTRVAIVGRSGSGKTTLVKCLAGLLEPTQGVIRYDGADLATLDYQQLRRRVGFVLQENFLFSDTIARNIAFGDEQLDIEQIEWAARAANAHEFIVRLPLRYETKVGESGVLLSGGQRQRIAIARALYHRPAVLVLDEATSSLDAESERAVQDNLNRLLEARTSFVIAHRMSTIRNSDVILVLDKGRLVERGSHDDLIARKGLYFYLSSQQLDL